MSECLPDNPCHEKCEDSCCNTLRDRLNDVERELIALRSLINTTRAAALASITDPSGEITSGKSITGVTLNF